MRKYTRIETDNPLLDEIVNSCKIMMSECVLKDEKRADKYETVDSLRNANVYMSIIEKRCKFEYLEYDYDDYIAVGVFPLLIEGYLDNPKTVPEGIRTLLINRNSKIFLDEYVETNNYYRRLLGLPDMEDTEFIYLNEDQLMSINMDNIEDYRKVPIHLLPYEIKFILNETNITDDIIEQNPHKYYLKFLTKNISIYNARKAEKFGLIYLDDAGVESILYSRFKEVLDKNRVYIMKTMDFKSYDFYSDYYERFVMMMIIVQTVSDMINELPEYYIRRDIFDIRTIEYFFEANGVEFFPDIPTKYQRILVKNLNKLIKYKATTTNIVDICSLFGFSNVEIFKYYLCKTRNLDQDGEYLDTLQNEDEEEYNLKFLKVPLEESADESAKRASSYMTYESVVAKDPYWNGPYSHDYVKKKILEYEFNMVKSKYISIDTVYSLTEASFELSYFINMVMFSNIPKNRLKLTVPTIDIGREVEFMNLFMFLYSLMYEYIGVEDKIITVPSGYLKIKGFNFNADLTKLGNYVREKGYTLKDLGVSGFQIPSNGIMTYNQLVAVFINNKQIYDHIVYEMEHTDDLELYRIYRHIYESIMVTDLNFEHFYIKELGRPAETYFEYLKYKEEVLYEKIEYIREERDHETKKTVIYNLITNISTHITDLLDNPDLKHIFINLPTESGEYLKMYMYKIINFFKSYKINIHDIQTIYKLDKENKVYMIDTVDVAHYYLKEVIIPMKDRLRLTTNLHKDVDFDIFDEVMSIISIHKPEDKVKVEEVIAWLRASMTYDEKIKMNDKFKSILTTMNPRADIPTNDARYSYNYLYDWEMRYIIDDEVILKSIFDIKEIYVINELLRIYRWYNREYMVDTSIYDKIYLNININATDKCIIEDYVFIDRV